MKITITNEQQIPVTLSPRTDAGRPALLDGVPVWSVVSGEATLHVSEDGLTATLVSPETPGTSQILVEADADLGEGVVKVSEIIELTVNGALATNLGLTVGNVELKPTA